MAKYRLTENRLRGMIREAVKGMINEYGDTPQGQFNLGRLAGRYSNYAHQAAAENDLESSGKWGAKRDDVKDYANMNGKKLLLKIKRKLDQAEAIISEINNYLLTETFLDDDDIYDLLGGLFNEFDNAKSKMATWANGDNFKFENGYYFERND